MDLGASGVDMARISAQPSHLINSFPNPPGYPESAVNLDVLPSEKLVFHDRRRPWLADRADTVAWQFRVNEFVNPSEAAPYLDKVWPVFLLQAHGGKRSAAPQPLQSPPLRPRGTGHSEEWLRAPLRKLRDALEARLAERGLKLTHVFPMAPNVPDSDRCMVDFDYCPIARPLPAWNRTDCISTCDWFTKVRVGWGRVLGWAWGQATFQWTLCNQRLPTPIHSHRTRSTPCHRRARTWPII